jgi:hypothetical protein
LMGWSGWVNVRSALANMHRHQVSLPVGFWSWGHSGLSARNHKWVRIAVFSPWMENHGFETESFFTDALRVCECRSHDARRMQWDVALM